MNKLEQFVRDQIKKGLAQLPEENHTLFKRMYSHDDLSRDIYQVVDIIPLEKINIALNQVERTVQQNRDKIRQIEAVQQLKPIN